MQFLALSLLSMLLISGSLCQECTTDEGQSGYCTDWTEDGLLCEGGVAQGYCPGDYDNRCCLDCPTGESCNFGAEDQGCGNMDGVCKDTSNYCSGIYDATAGLCGNNDSDGLDRQCCRPLQADECPTIISREEWGARSPTSITYLDDNLPYYFTHHSEGSDCYDVEECSAVVRAIQDYHMDSNGWNDIGYNFLVGGDGNIYEGRGFGVQGAHTENFNSVGYGTCFIGDFMTEVPTAAAINAGIAFQGCVQVQGYIASDYEMYGHRQTKDTDCPGDALFTTIQTFPHWVNDCIAPAGEQCCC